MITIGRCTIHHGDTRAVLAGMPDNSVNAVVTDPPYGLEFMGKEWDSPWRTGDGFRRTRNSADTDRDNQFGRLSRRGPEYRAGLGFQAWCTEWAADLLRVLKPGGHLLAFGGTRTYHRLACAIEDAGFDIRDSIGCLTWAYGQGFPKSRNIALDIDRIAGVEPRIVGLSPHSSPRSASSYQADGTTHGYIGNPEGERLATAPATDDAQRWHGWGTALAPAWEPIIVARKPLQGTVAGNVLAHGTGGINITATRIAHGPDVNLEKRQRQQTGDDNGWRLARSQVGTDIPLYKPDGRWPKNQVLIHHPHCDDNHCVPDCHIAQLDHQSGDRPSTPYKWQDHHAKDRVALNASTDGSLRNPQDAGYNDSGGASRFFPTFRYQPKADATERPVILVDGKPRQHETVKPLELMRWLVRLVTPPGGTVLDPFCGSGTTLEAAHLEGAHAIGIDQDPDSIAMTQQRLNRRLNPTAWHKAAPPKAADPQASIFDYLNDGDTEPPNRPTHTVTAPETLL